MSDSSPTSTPGPGQALPGPAVGDAAPGVPGAVEAVRDIADVPAVEVVTTAAVHLMSAAAVKCGLVDPADLEGAVGEDGRPLRPEDLKDLAEARSLITALAGLVTAAAPEVGSQHARALRDGLRSLQLAFREASIVQDEPGQGPGERLTGPVSARRGPSAAS
ncbi:DUF1844 domain-containing protein [Aquipuribacter sp. SD81]|uniref:DUF1844 domain-containing protein n=1 Tax=Aquipuribacter sp. SD81 TaxID=3127703 RepID=UPI003FA59E54